MRRRLYILVLGAILIAQTWTASAQSRETGQAKKKIQIILVEKKERDKPANNNGGTERPRRERRQ